MDRFILVQKKKIEVDKWCEGVGRGCDPGRPYVVEWINRHASWFRQAWLHSLCRFCAEWGLCGHLVEKRCTRFKPNKVD